MIGSVPSLNQNTKEAMAKDKISRVEDLLDWDISSDIDSISYDPTLSDSNASAQTRFCNGSTEVVFGDDFFERRPYEDEWQRDLRQLSTTIHELVHVSDFNGRLDNDLRYWGASPQAAYELSDNVGSPLKDVEGSTEVITDNLMQNLTPYADVVGSGYPEWKLEKERELASKGIDPDLDIDNSLVKDIEQLQTEVEQYVSEEEVSTRYIEDFGIGRDFYHEKGTVKGIDYEVTVVGDYAGLDGMDIADSYVESIENYLEDENTGLASENYVSTDEASMTPEYVSNALEDIYAGADSLNGFNGSDKAYV